MAVEIERKFLVRSASWKDRIVDTTSIEQGYLTPASPNTVRVRLADGMRAWLTVKAPSDGSARAEFEYSIPPEDARDLLVLCGRRTIAKRRHLLDYVGAEWIVDEFEGRHAGLVLCEVEFKQGVGEIETPDWLGDEVTGDPRYYNAHLAAEDGEI
jgi:CYTH domain-containing protein